MKWLLSFSGCLGNSFSEEEEDFDLRYFAAQLKWESNMSHIKKITAFFTLTVLVLLINIPATKADNSNIPGEYESLYHRLLEQKQRHLDDRADSIRNLNMADSWISQLDKAMISSPTAMRQRLMVQRVRMQGVKDEYQKDLNFEESQLTAIEKDLAWLEGEMKHFACMK